MAIAADTTILKAGERFVMSAADRPFDELIRVAAAASRTRARVEFTGLRSRPIEELMRLAAAGGDAVTFEAEREEPAPRPSPRRRWFARAA